MVDLLKPWAMERDGDAVEITLYGEIVESRPVNYWTGEEIPGEYIVQNEFLADLEQLEDVKILKLRLNSVGGSCVAGFVIHNRLREMANAGTEIICTVDGLAASAASVIMCAADTVRVNPVSLVMVHNCWSFLFGGYNAADLKQLANSMESYDKAIRAAYSRKTGLSDTVLKHLMEEETYMTGAEAVEKGFADELTENSEPLNIAASADRRSLIVNGRRIHIPIDAPESIPTLVTPEAPAAADEANTSVPAETGGKEGSPMTMDELREQFPDVVAEIEANARASAENDAASNATAAERQRLAAIDEVANLFGEDLVKDAKYGENPCTAQELAYRAAKQAALQGKEFLTNLDADSKASGTSSVGAAVPPVEDIAETEEQKYAEAQSAVRAALGKEAK